LKPRGRLALAAAGVLVVVVALVALLAFSGGSSTSVDCSRFRVTPDIWAKANYDRRLQLREGLQDCDQVDGQPDTQVIAMLGPPDGGGTSELDYFLPYPDRSDRQVWRIHLGDDGRVEGTELVSPTSGP
jgi:hypothetical protein